jgi:deoxyribodipyrimidine photo-lyase
MRQLNTVGYMHNRGRLISANFMNRIFGLDWRLGEKYFATQLIDYDPLVNNGNWQWIASTGCDTKPYFQRLFNPWLQGERYDKECEYIKQWLPELKDIPAKHLHKWSEYHQEYDLKKLGYLAPVVNYEEGREKSLKMYKQIF